MSDETIVVLGVIRAYKKRLQSISVLKWARLYRHFLSPGLGRQTSRNLDVTLTGREHFVWFFRYAKVTNIAVIKGVMGLYDSVDGVTELSSTADAKRTGDTCVAPRLAEKLVKLLSDEGIEVLVVMPKSKAVADAFLYRYLGLVPVGERGNSLVFT